MLLTHMQIAKCHENLGDPCEAVRVCGSIYEANKDKPLTELVLSVGLSYATSLVRAEKFQEAKILLEDMMDKARPKFGDHQVFFKLIETYCFAVRSLSAGGDATADEVRDACKMLEEAVRRSRRLFGAAHPQTINMEHNLGVLQNWMGFTQFATRAYEAHKQK